MELGAEEDDNRGMWRRQRRVLYPASESEIEGRSSKRPFRASRTLDRFESQVVITCEYVQRWQRRRPGRRTRRFRQ